MERPGIIEFVTHDFEVADDRLNSGPWFSWGSGGESILWREWAFFCIERDGISRNRPGFSILL